MHREKDTEYDAIIIGAGHNGMALSTYLGKSGWKVLCLERRYEEGGGLTTEYFTEPGFLHNLHSNYHSLVGMCPAYDDLDLIGGDGVTYAHPPVQMGSVFKDGTAMTIHTDMEKTHASMARFSVKDADTFRRLYKEVKGFQAMMISSLMYGAPIDLNDMTRALAIWKVEDKTEFFRAANRTLSINDFLNKYFENEKVKTMLAFHAVVCGYLTDVKGLAVSFPFMLGKIDNWQCCINGSHRLAHRLWRQMRRADAVLMPGYQVDEILLNDDGRAVGVRCEGGQEFHASKLVASSIDLNQTLGKMLPEGTLTKEMDKKVEETEYQEGSLYSVHMALDKIPTYKAAEFDPDINQAWIVNVGYETLEEFNADWRDIRNNIAPKDPKFMLSFNSLFDPTDAPEGKATGLIRATTPFNVGDGGSATWATGFSEVYKERCIDKMLEYVSDDFTREDIIKAMPYTPLDTATKLTNMVNGDWMVGRIAVDNLLGDRPMKELSQYKTPVDGLYLCGSCTHPHGFITFGPAYNSLNVIADDFDLEKWWEEI
jgi:phytoene dehydrogenase-like protein